MTKGETSRIIIDLDGTLTHDDPLSPYSEKLPRLDVIDRLREYQSLGFIICIFTARNMRTYEGNVGKIAVHTLPIIDTWLKKHRVPFDEIVIGKPWCGPEGFYVDDRAIRPDEFALMTRGEVISLLTPSEKD